MRPFRFQTGLERAIVGGFAWPLGVEPSSITDAPRQGYFVEYHPGQDDHPDTYSFIVFVSHERLGPLVRRAFDLLGREVAGIVEIGSRDAYRSVDTFLSGDVIDRSEFLESWGHFETLLLEDVSIGAGAYQDEPYLEVFVDSLKVLNIFTSVGNRDEIEQLLREAGLDELDEFDPTQLEAAEPRSVLEHLDDFSPDLDELVVALRDAWSLELDVDPDRNVDEGGRELGRTLWNVVAVVYRTTNESLSASDEQGSIERQHQSGGEPAVVLGADDEVQTDDDYAYAICWLTASSLHEAEQIAADAIEASDWRLDEFYSTDRIAFDERPDELSDLDPRRTKAELHLMRLDAWDREHPEAATDCESET